MTSLLNIAAPAKLNLFLHITGRRADGYHLLQSAFMLLDWCDTLHFELRPDGRISREDLTQPLPADDLITRAAHALQKLTGTLQGVHIQVEKSIPSQAGMGGGSSDAASCLLALNRLWQLHLSKAQLMQIGVSLGADVPFFLGGQNAWVEGIGEQISPLAIPFGRFIVVKPQNGVSTPAIFNAPDLNRNSETAIISGFTAQPFDFGRNDLQRVAQNQCPDVSEAIEWLENLDGLGLKPRMTGSGSAVFAHLNHAANHKVKNIEDLDLKTAPKNAVIKICDNLMLHPLHEWIAELN